MGVMDRRQARIAGFLVVRDRAVAVPPAEIAGPFRTDDSRAPARCHDPDGPQAWAAGRGSS